MMVIINARVFFENRFWVGVFECTDKEGFSVAKHVFGGEPSNQEIYDFVLNKYHKLDFGKPKEFDLKIKRVNPKRAQREVRREMKKVKEITKPSTFAQDYMREELEKKNKAKKSKSSAEKQALKDKQFSIKQQKKKEKNRGH